MPTTFIAKATRFQVTLEPQLPVVTPTGGSTWTRGKRVEFNKGVFVATDTKAKELGYQSEAELVDALRQARTLNTEFFEKGNEPGAINPPTPELLASIMSAAMRRQDVKLREIIAQEEGTHQREEILAAARRALAELGDTTEGKRGPGRPPKQPVEAA